MFASRVIEVLVMGALLCAVSPAFVRAADAAPTTIDACSLLNEAEIRSALGVEVEKGSKRDSGRESNGAYSSACVWLFKGEADRPIDRSKPLGGRSFVILNAQRWPKDSAGPRTFLEAFREANESGVIAAKPSPRRFGDEALWWGDGLAVRRRDVSFGVSVFSPRDGAARANAQPGEREGRLAQAILVRLASQDSGTGGNAR
jgi:hypothetical protein